MPRCTVDDFDVWRTTARAWLQAGVEPGSAEFVDAADPQPALFSEDSNSTAATNASGLAVAVPRRFLDSARIVACHRDTGRYDLLYSVLWRLTHGEANLLEIATDDDTYRLSQMEKAVRRSAHKTKAFVRFRKIADGDVARYVAWHQPEHCVLPLVAPFFARRFASMRWTILTPDASVSWDLERLLFGAGCPASAAPSGDALEELWKIYYGAIFNPARIKMAMMKREMPVRHWATLPETRILPELLDDAPRRVAEMLRHAAARPVQSAADFLPQARDLASLAEAAKACQGCDLHGRALQTVFGRGPATARIMLIGEQPGDEEDLRGEPFVGPAGRVLDEALTAAKLAREDIYVTNAVKHFHWEPGGKRRLHKKPPVMAVNACRPWLDAEFAALAPEVVVCLGVTAAQAVLRRDGRHIRPRGEFFASTWSPNTLITWHPAAVLRAPTEADRTRLQRELIEHLQAVAERARGTR